MNSQALIKSVTANLLKKVPEVRPGYTVRVHQKIKEGNKERIQKFQGLVIKVNSGSGVDKTFTVRGTYSGVGVEKIFPLYSTNIKKIDIIKKASVRRSKLYYMRALTGKAARLQEQYVKEQEVLEDPVEAKAEEDEKKVEENKDEQSETSGAPSDESSDKAEKGEGEAKTEKKVAEEKVEKPEESKAETPEQPEESKKESDQKPEKGEKSA